MTNSATAVLSIPIMWIAEKANDAGWLPFWLALIVAAIAAFHAGRAVHRIIRGFP